jgi:hypothetical protein
MARGGSPEVIPLLVPRSSGGIRCDAENQSAREEYLSPAHIRRATGPPAATVADAPRLQRTSEDCSMDTRTPARRFAAGQRGQD